MDKKDKNPNVPNLRFPSFTNSYCVYTLGEVLQRVSNPVNIDENKLYYQIGIRSHSKGVFYKKAETGKQIGNKRIFWIESNCLILNIVFAWEQAVAKTSQKEIGRVASHRFPMYKVLNNSLDYIVDFFKTEKGRQVLQMASPGGAGRNKTLNQKFFLSSKVYLPSLKEQLIISRFITLIENRIETQIKIIDAYSSFIKAISNTLIGCKKENIEIGRCLDCYSSNIKEKDLELITSGNYPVYGANGCIKKISKYNISGSSIAIIKDGANVGKITKLNGKYSILSTMNYLTAKQGYDLNYLYYSLKQKSLKKYVVGSGIPHIYFKDYKQEKIYIPHDRFLIANITSLLTNIDEMIQIETKKLDKYKSQKQYLLKNMFI